MAVRKGHIKGPAMELSPLPPRPKDQGLPAVAAAGTNADTGTDGVGGDVIAASPDQAGAHHLEQVAHPADLAGTGGASGAAGISKNAAQLEEWDAGKELPHVCRGAQTSRDDVVNGFGQELGSQQAQRRASLQRASLPGQQEGYGGAAPVTTYEELQQAVPPDADGMTMRLLLEEKPEAGGWPAGATATGWGMGSMATGRGSVGSNLMTVNLVGMGGLGVQVHTRLGVACSQSGCKCQVKVINALGLFKGPTNLSTRISIWRLLRVWSLALDASSECMSAVPC
jgi:hypothetical protein